MIAPAVARRGYVRVAAACAVVTVLAHTLAIAPAAAQTADEPLLVNAVVAQVDGNPITLQELETFAAGRGRLLPPDERSNQETLLDSLIQSYMLRGEFSDQGIVGADADVETYIDNILEQSNSSREDLRAALDDLGISWDDYFDRMREEMQRLSLVNREIRSRVNVTPEEIERHWKKSDEFALSSRVEISDIFIPYPERGGLVGKERTRRTIAEAYKAAKSDGFEDAAREYSKGPTAADGGLLGEFGTGTMAPEFEEQLDRLDEGDISEPFDAAGGMHILKLERRLDGGRVPLEEVEEEIREKLYVEHLNSRFTRWIEEDLRERHHVTVHLRRFVAMPRYEGS